MAAHPRSVHHICTLRDPHSARNTQHDACDSSSPHGQLRCWTLAAFGGHSIPVSAARAALSVCLRARAAGTTLTARPPSFVTHSGLTGSETRPPTEVRPSVGPAGVFRRDFLVSQCSQTCGHLIRWPANGTNSSRLPLFALVSVEQDLLPGNFLTYCPACIEHGARVGRCCFWRSDAEGRKAQSVRSPEVADESATGSVF